jgi:hypothetical protein
MATKTRYGASRTLQRPRRNSTVVAARTDGVFQGQSRLHNLRKEFEEGEKRIKVLGKELDELKN